MLIEASRVKPGDRILWCGESCQAMNKSRTIIGCDTVPGICLTIKRPRRNTDPIRVTYEPGETVEWVES